MRRLKWAFSRSVTSFSRPAASLARSSDAFMSFSGWASGAHLARHEGGAQRQLGRSQLERFAGQLFRHAVDFIEHLARLDFSHVVLRVALAVAHPDFGRLLRNQLFPSKTDQ